MPLTAAERQAKRRKKLKENKEYDKYKERSTLQKREQRIAHKRKEDKLPHEERMALQDARRKKTRERVAKCRAKKKQASTPIDASGSPVSPVYKSAQALGKAVAKAQRSLPQSPRRLHAVCKRLADRFVQPSMPSSSTAPTPKPHNKLPDETVGTVIGFYERDDISRQCPGRKDVVVVRDNNGMKHKLQARHLTSPINEVYCTSVLLNSKIPQNVCLCKYHENFIMAVDKLHQVTSSFPAYQHELLEKFICESPSEDCWLNACESCSCCEHFRILRKNYT